MLTYLNLTNFEKHESLELRFTGGLQVLRGANERGKSAIFRAIAYAFGGARALPFALDEHVTWGKMPSALKVEMGFAIGGTEYVVIRKASGASLKGGGVVSEGQAEVTAAVERLMGAASTTWKNTMFANQKALADSITAGSTGLIEKLANMKLIDELTEKVQQNLPTGNTKVLEAQVQSMGDLTEPVLDLGTLEQDLALAKEAEEYAASGTVQSENDLDEARIVMQRFHNKERDNAAAVEGQRITQEQIAAAEKELFEVQEFLSVNEKRDATPLMQGQQNEKTAAAVRSAWLLFSQIKPWPEDKYENREQVQAVINTANEQLVRNGQLGEQLKRDIQTCKNSIQTNDKCKSCGQTLPEAQLAIMTANNAKLKAREQELSASYNELDEATEQLQLLLGKNRPVWEYDSMMSKFLRDHKLHAYVDVDMSVVPQRVTWSAGEVPQAGAPRDWAAEIKVINDHNTAIATAQRRADQLKATIPQLHIKYSSYNVVLISEVERQSPAYVKLCESAHQRATAALKDAEDTVRQIASELNRLKTTYATEKKAYDKAKAEHTKMLELLKQYYVNNAILVKLRGARPVVAKKLWALVLTGVSHYFSQVRGTTSTVTRDDGGFLVDGKPAGAHSGSTVDSLGLAVRIMLQKTFLPNINFMLVDEPGAACDEERETAMIAQFASVGFDQVILVTHSDLADSFAANVIQV